MLLTCCVILLTLVASLVLVSHSQCTLLVFSISFYAFDGENSKYQQCVLSVKQTVVQIAEKCLVNSNWHDAGRIYPPYNFWIGFLSKISKHFVR